MWYAQAIAPLLNVSPALLDSIKHITLDSRCVEAGSLYVAIIGEKVDGHQFIDQAQKKGAVAALVHKDYSKKHPGLLLIQVEDVTSTLQQMAKKVVEFWKPIVIGITGSIGKTSTKEFVYALLNKTLSIHKTPGNFNTQLTLPITVLNTEGPTDYLLLEMGMDRPGELDRLIDIAPPDIAILTQLAHVHLEPFKTFERLAEEKLKIFGHKETELGIYSLDMPFADLAQKKGDSKKITCSLKEPSANYFLKEEKDELFFYRQGQFVLKFKPPLSDVKSRINLLFALALADTLKVSIQAIAKQIPTIQFPEKRMVELEHNGIFYLNDAYNSCVESVENALLSLAQKKGRRIAILSPMVEQGIYEVQNHQKIACLALRHADLLVGYGEEMQEMIPIWRKSGKKWAFFLSYPHLLAYLSKLLKKNDAVLIKGSRKYALERLLNDITSC